MASNSPALQPAYAPWQFSHYTIAFEGSSVACILIGVYFTIAGTNLYLLHRKRYRLLSVYTIIQLALTLLYFGMSLYTAPATSLEIFNIISGPGHSFVSLSPWSAVVVSVAFVLNTWISDVFLLYRCYVICQGNKYALAIPALLYVVTLGSSLAFLVVSSYPGAVYGTHAVQVTGIGYWSCSAAMNICASSVISVRLWMHQRALSKILGSKQGKFYLDYMAMTLESALLYTAFVIIALVVFALNSPLELVVFPVLGIVQAIAPSLIVYRIACGISFESDKFGSMTGSSINFTSSGRTWIDPESVHQDKSDGSAVAQVSAYDNSRVELDSDLPIHEMRLQVRDSGLGSVTD